LDVPWATNWKLAAGGGTQPPAPEEASEEAAARLRSVWKAASSGEGTSSVESLGGAPTFCGEPLE